MRARTLIAAIAGLVLARALVAHADGLSREMLEGLRLTPPVASTPPPLALARLDNGRTQTLSDLRGRPVLLYFWATW
jgi:thiol-disulfide isomerase/thioredoxin